MWSDYVCPWCYVGLDRSARLVAELGVAVQPLPFELHPSIPVGGRDVSKSRVFDRIARECEAVGLPFVAPSRVPNSRRALASSEWVRRHSSAPVHGALHRSLFSAVFVDGLAIDDAEVVDALVAAAGADAGACRAAVDWGSMDAVLAASRDEAYDHGITGTPSWLVDGRLVIAGLQPFETFDRLVTRLRARPTTGG